MIDARARRAAGALLLAALTAAAPAVAEVQVRVEVGAGPVHSDLDVGFTESTAIGTFSGSSRSAIGSRGSLLTGALWIDGLPFRDLSLGAEYLRTDTDSRVGLGFTTLGQSASLDAELNLDIDTVMLNAAWRRNGPDPFHPYVGVGLGASRLKGRIRADAIAGPFGPFPFELVDTEALAPSGQLFAGVDYDIADRVYVGAAGRYYLIDGRLFGREEVLRELSAQLKLGVRF
jgi:opacity protein-like surface antigen